MPFQRACPSLLDALCPSLRLTTSPVSRMHGPRKSRNVCSQPADCVGGLHVLRQRVTTRETIPSRASEDARGPCAPPTTTAMTAVTPTSSLFADTMVLEMMNTAMTRDGTRLTRWDGTQGSERAGLCCKGSKTSGHAAVGTGGRASIAIAIAIVSAAAAPAAVAHAGWGCRSEMR